ncbi:MAG: DNA polymerase III subunit epsilon [Alphaproteobacteria bacterium]|nr:DNA polymerase III subunit epsilon [Alphaproteobacteria bacterium]
MREIVLDTETTGLEPNEGHRVIEIACLELDGSIPTGLEKVWRLDPEREIDPAAFEVHGISRDMLRGQKRFADIVHEFGEFIADSRLVIHNAEFDRKFLDRELSLAGRPPLVNPIVDTLQLARAKFPGQRNSLDELCKRFAIDLSGRTRHGALIDIRLLAKVYLELVGGRQRGLDLTARKNAKGEHVVARPVRPARPHAPAADELAAHQAFVGSMPKALWNR